MTETSEEAPLNETEAEPKARIFLADDTPIIVRTMKRILRSLGYEVPLSTMNFAEALRFIDEGELEEAGINVAILDNDMQQRDDGERIAAAIREKVNSKIEDPAKRVKIVSHSSRSDLTWGDLNLIKEIDLDEGQERMGEALRQLIAPQEIPPKV